MEAPMASADAMVRKRQRHRAGFWATTFCSLGGRRKATYLLSPARSTALWRTRAAIWSSTVPYSYFPQVAASTIVANTARSPYEWLAAILAIFPSYYARQATLRDTDLLQHDINHCVAGTHALQAIMGASP